jgi:restriction endonuclease Mrr
MVVAQRESRGDALLDFPEARSDALVDRLERLKAVAAGRRVDTDHLPGAVVDGGEDPGLALVDRQGLGRVGAPHLVRTVGKSGDGGIDGIIKEDRLGLDAIYIQAKRWQGNVGRPDVQAFVGALTGHRAKKGVFITTSDYSRDAREYVKNLEAKVVLIDGRTLAEYMIEVGLGVSLVQTYEVRRLDSDFFEE